MSKFIKQILFQKSFFMFVLFPIILSFLCMKTVFAAESVSQNDTTDDSVTVSKQIFHVHTGSSGGGGCYSRRCEGSKTETTDCGGTMVYDPRLGTTACSRCGAGYHGDQSGRSCWTTYEHTVSYSYYDLGCNKSTGTVVGTLSLTQSTKRWTKQLILTASYENNGMQVSAAPFIWNGVAGSDNGLQVTENGTYTLQLNADGNTGTGAAILSAVIENIDHTAPVISDYSLTPTEWTKEGVLFQTTEVKDIQPDGREGCGLHETPYSYDGGETWETTDSHMFTENGEYSVKVRDWLENESEITFTIENIDKTGPAIQKTDYDHTKNIAATSLTIEGKDLQPDGREGCGLHETPYSYDGGKTWVKNSVFAVTKSMMVKLCVRDKLLNISRLDVDINNIDSFGPKVWHELYPGSWTNQDVKVFFYAEDKNADGSEGAGLADKCFSFDGGETFSEDNVLIMQENGRAAVIAKDIYGNETWYGIDISNIDKIPPTASLTYINQENSIFPKIVLQAEGKDNESGLHNCAYSWDGGTTYSANSQYMVNQNGEYTVTIRDNAGNTASASVLVEAYHFKKIKNIPKEVKTSVTPMSTKKVTKEVSMPTVIVNRKAEVVREVKKNPWGIKEIIFLCSTIAVLLMLLAFLFLYFFFTIRIFAEDNGRMNFIRRVRIRKKEQFLVEISEEVLKQCMTTHFVFKPSYLFYRIYQGREMNFVFPEGKYKNLIIYETMETVIL